MLWSKHRLQSNANPKADNVLNPTDLIQKPVVCSEGPVEPHAVVEAGNHQAAVRDQEAVGEEGRLEEGEVGGVRGSGLVQRLVAAQVAPGTPPDELPKPRVKGWVRRLKKVL
jgi:hypothetical protein